MDIIIEVFLEIYMEFMMLITHTETPSKTQNVIAKILAILVILVVFGLVIWGAILIFDHANYLGFIPIAFAVIISVVQIVAGVIIYNKYHKNK